MDSITFEYRSDAFPALQAAVLSAFEAGAPRVILDLDGLERLDTEAVRGLITLLRRSREIGGELAISTTRAEINRSLAVMALDRIFPMVAAA